MKEISQKLNLISKTKGLSNKFKIIKYFLIRKMSPCKINISKTKYIFIRKNKPNDLYMAMESDKNFFKFVKEQNFKRIIDIGANIGKYSLIFSENKNSKIISFEPVKNNYLSLIDNIKKNKIKNILAYNKGCYNFNGKIKINLCKENEGGHSIVFNHNFKKETIEVVKIDILLKENFKPDLIKIDVEGAELNVLKGAEKIISKYKPVIFFEILNSYNKKEVFNFLEKKGYSINYEENSNYLAIPKLNEIGGKKWK